ncbi:MAG: hypothetical protein ACMG6E_00960, partial [Candidatus Roizmanbacteria bacterium]
MSRYNDTRLWFNAYLTIHQMMNDRGYDPIEEQMTFKAFRKWNEKAETQGLSSFEFHERDSEDEVKNITYVLFVWHESVGVGEGGGIMTLLTHKTKEANVGRKGKKKVKVDFVMIYINLTVQAKGLFNTA